MLQSKCDLPGTPQHGGSIELADTSQATQPHGHLRKTKILFTVSIRNQVYWNNVEWKKGVCSLFSSVQGLGHLKGSAYLQVLGSESR